ncbi:MAG: hypothetical protein QM783_11110 [Phycisphaerales bacterium]
MNAAAEPAPTELPGVVIEDHGSEPRRCLFFESPIGWRGAEGRNRKFEYVIPDNKGDTETFSYKITEGREIRIEETAPDKIMIKARLIESPELSDVQAPAHRTEAIRKELNAQSLDWTTWPRSRWNDDFLSRIAASYNEKNTRDSVDSTVESSVGDAFFVRSPVGKGAKWNYNSTTNNVTVHIDVELLNLTDDSALLAFSYTSNGPNITSPTSSKAGVRDVTSETRTIGRCTWKPGLPTWERSSIESVHFETRTLSDGAGHEMELRVGARTTSQTRLQTVPSR